MSEFDPFAYARERGATKASRLVHQEIATLGDPEKLDEAMHEALVDAGVDEIPANSFKLSTFIRGPLRDALLGRYPEPKVTGVIEHLVREVDLSALGAHVQNPTGPIPPRFEETLIEEALVSAMDRSLSFEEPNEHSLTSPPELDAIAESAVNRPTVVFFSSDRHAAQSLRGRLQSHNVEHRSSEDSLGEALANHRHDQPVVIIDARESDPSAVMNILGRMTADQLVVAWGYDGDWEDRPGRWSRCDADAHMLDVAALVETLRPA